MHELKATPPPLRRYAMRALGWSVVLLVSSAVVGQGSAAEDRSTLTPEAYRKHCMLCHKSTAPEGIAPEILAGLHSAPGKTARDAMPNTACWRRCTKCWPQNPPRADK